MKDWDHLVDQVKLEVLAARTQHWPNHIPRDTVTRFGFSEPGHPQKMGGLLAEGIQVNGSNPTPQPPDPRRINMIEAIRRTLEVELNATRAA